MNGKRARSLRKLVGGVQLNAPIPNVSYREEIKAKQVQVGINPDGTPSKVWVQRKTFILDVCMRALYQYAKRRHYLYTHH